MRLITNTLPRNFFYGLGNSWCILSEYSVVDYSTKNRYLKCTRVCNSIQKLQNDRRHSFTFTQTSRRKKAYEWINLVNLTTLGWFVSQWLIGLVLALIAALVQFYILSHSLKIIGHGGPGVVRCYVRDTIDFMSHTIAPGIWTNYWSYSHLMA